VGNKQQKLDFTSKSSAVQQLEVLPARDKTRQKMNLNQ
jgi:hypothetical protein